MLLGGVMLYATIHTCIISQKKEWKKRTNYEQVVSVFGWITIGLIFISVMIQ